MKLIVILGMTFGDQVGGTLWAYALSVALDMVQKDLNLWELGSAQEWGSVHSHPVTCPEPCFSVQNQTAVLRCLCERCPVPVSCVLPTAEPQGLIPGVIGAIVVAVAGAISSFIAYQKKKFCFKENGKVFSCASCSVCLANLKTRFLKKK